MTYTLRCEACGRRIAKATDDGRRQRRSTRYCPGSSTCRMKAMRLRRKLAALTTGGAQ